MAGGGALFDVADEMTIRILVDNGASVGAELRWGGASARFFTLEVDQVWGAEHSSRILTSALVSVQGGKPTSEADLQRLDGPLAGTPWARSPIRKSERCPGRHPLPRSAL